MRRWNGWGDEATVVELPAHGAAFLENLVGSGQLLKDATLEQVLAQVPESRLSRRHPLISAPTLPPSPRARCSAHPR